MSEKIKVLVSDDNQDFAKTLVIYLSKDEDLEVVGVARDGQDAYDKILATKPDIASLDIIMPHLDGLGVFRKIKFYKYGKETYVHLLISSRTRQNNSKSN